MLDGRRLMTENAKPKWTLWAIGNAIAVFPIVLLFHYLGKPTSGYPAALFVSLLGMVIRVRWELSRHAWFWMTVVAIIVIHAPLIWLVPWTSKWVPAFLIAPFCIVDALVILGIVNLVEKLSGSVTTSSSESQ
jgi:hypothetical protein